MSFTVSGDAYDRFMGRYSVRLAPLFADFAGLEVELRVLDVGCGPGALTGELVRRVGSERVAAIDPAAQFVEACRSRFPGVDARVGPAEQLPWPDDSFDAAFAQLVVSFMRDAPRAVREMKRVVRSGGVAAACMWDSAGGMEMLKLFWDTVRVFDGSTPDDENRMRYRREEELRELWTGAGLGGVETAPLDVVASYDDFDEFWQAMLGGAGPIGAYLAKLDDERKVVLREELRVALGDPAGSFTLKGRAWAVRGRA